MNFLNLKKNIYENPAANIIVDDERQYFFLNIVNKVNIRILTNHIQFSTESFT